MDERIWKEDCKTSPNEKALWREQSHSLIFPGQRTTKCPFGHNERHFTPDTFNVIPSTTVVSGHKQPAWLVSRVSVSFVWDASICICFRLWGAHETVHQNGCTVRGGVQHWRHWGRAVQNAWPRGHGV